MNVTPIRTALCVVVFNLPVFVQAATDTIRVYGVGSSSFSTELGTDVKYIVEASGDYHVQFSHSDYTRLDEMAAGITSYDEWLAENMPIMTAGRFDFVIVQTISWHYLSPEMHRTLFGEILPDMTAKIRSTGAEIILYDKFPPSVICYPGDSEDNNALLHYWAAREAGITKVAWSGEVINELIADFAYMDFLFTSTHPGSMANHISACNLSYHITGIRPWAAPCAAWPCKDGRLSFSLSFRRPTLCTSTTLVVSPTRT